MEYRTIDKSDWTRGPWDDEPDKKQWTDADTGLPCLIVRNDFGALCGYVGVSPTHAFHGTFYDEVDVKVHGGLTFSRGCQHNDEKTAEELEATAVCHVPEEGQSDNVWWLGFDCGHCGDFQPNHHMSSDFFTAMMHSIAIQCGMESSAEEDVSNYRTLQYVENECRQLAKQLAPVMEGGFQ